MQLQLYGNKIWLFRQPVDFRCSINGLSTFVANNTQNNPQHGIYLFFNKTKDKIKLLSWHKNGYILCYKRLEKGKFIFEFNKSQGVMEMSIEEIGWLLAGLEWQKMRSWRELSYDKFN
ncbi:MAG: IS66 family insertion sequence element accessory protein TnpB [Methanobacteriaceae archaeon]